MMILNYMTNENMIKNIGIKITMFIVNGKVNQILFEESPIAF